MARQIQEQIKSNAELRRDIYLKNKEITIELTNRCSARCSICPREKFTYPIGDMPNELFYKIIDDAAASGVKILDTCGFGDPFLCPDLFEKLSYVRRKHPEMKIYVSSTCINMTPKLYPKVLECIDTLKISFYGMTPEVYKKVHGGLDFNRALSNILGFLGYRSKNRKKRIYIIALLTVTDVNKHQMNEWINFWEPKVDEVYVWKPHNYVTARKYRDIVGKQQSSCGRPIYGPLNVAWDGKVHVCCFDFNKEMIVGDLKHQTIEEILDSEKFLEIQRKHKQNDFDGLICKYCDQTVCDESVLVYASNEKRRVGLINSSNFDLLSGQKIEIS